MYRFSKIQWATLAVGCIGVTLNSTGLLLDIPRLCYIAIFAGRLSGALYVCGIDKFHWWSFLPLTFTTFNIFVTTPELIFMEHLSQQIIYQVMAVKTFQKLSSRIIA